jgi:signal transduction histidine kinase
VERPEYQLKIASRDVNPLVERIVDTHKDLAREKGISLEMSLEPLFPVSMDAELIQESIANLVENAIKYTQKGGRVTVSTQEVGDWVQIRVTDNGPGIAADDRDKIFAKFYRGVREKNIGIRGSGLGLYLVKYFIELHGGTIEASDNPGGGAAFTINLLRK